jgi:hypothetical protein
VPPDNACARDFITSIRVDQGSLTAPSRAIEAQRPPHPAYRLAFAYTVNKHGVGTGLNERGQALIDATYTILGSPLCAPGFWVKSS